MTQNGSRQVQSTWAPFTAIDFGGFSDFRIARFLEIVDLGLGGKPGFVDLTRIGLVMRRRQLGFPAS